jgi:hypothetical protein
MMNISIGSPSPMRLRVRAADGAALLGGRCFSSRGVAWVCVQHCEQLGDQFIMGNARARFEMFGDNRADLTKRRKLNS